MKTKILYYEKRTWIVEEGEGTEVYEYLLWEKEGEYNFSGWANRNEPNESNCTIRNLCYRKKNMIHFLQYCAATQTHPDDVKDLMFDNLEGDAFSEPILP